MPSNHLRKRSKNKVPLRDFPIFACLRKKLASQAGIIHANWSISSMQLSVQDSNREKNWFAYQLHDLQKCVLTGQDQVKKCTDAPFFLPLRSCSTFPTFLSIAKIVTSHPKSSLLSAKSLKVRKQRFEQYVVQTISNDPSN